MVQGELNSIDAMTGLPDRESAMAQIETFLHEDFGNGQHAALIVGADNLSLVNESMGKIFGDTMIERIADGICACIKESDIAGRVGGDEFLVFLKHRTREEVIDVAMQMNQMFLELYTGGDDAVRVTGSIGIALYPRDGKNAAGLFEKAEKAMYVIKSRGKNWYQFYSPSDCEGYCPLDRQEKYDFGAEGHFPDCTDYNREMISFAFDVLSSTKSFDGGVNALLDRVGRYYGLDRIRVMHVNCENRAFEAAYMWKKKIVVMPKMLQTHGHFGSLEELKKGFNTTGVIQINEVREGELLDDIYRSCIELGITAVISCGIYGDDDELTGYIGFEMNNEAREWKKEERDTFCLLAKIMSHFLLVNDDSRISSREIEKLSSYDKVTGLYLYGSFKTEAARVISGAQPGSLAIVNSDISNFKYINDTYGQEVGDKILRAFAEKTVINNRYCIAGCRVYADNFITLIRTLGKERLASFIVKFNEEFEREQRLFYPDTDFKVHTGAYIIENPDTDLVQILDGASLARKKVKENTNLKYAFFDDNMKEIMLREGRVLAEVKTAILERKLVPYLQPKFSLETNEIIGAEALVRWKVDEETFYYPNDFIPVLERTGNITDVDFCIYHQVMELMHRWLEEGRKAVPVSVNISRMDCRHERLEKILIEMADRHQVPHHLIEIEITESAFFENADVLMRKLDTLRKAGFIISIDDFGSGYSSLSVISNMPIDVIKMDQSFLRSGLLSESSAYVIEAMIHLAKRMNLDIICEGVETREQIEFLLECGCHMGQGYIFAKPMPVAEFEETYLPL